MVANQRGVSVLEVIIGLAVITILATSVPVSGHLQLATAKRSYDELVASRAAAGRIETLRASDAAPASGPFDVELKGYRGLQEVIEREPGLFEVRVRVLGAGGRREIELTTLLVRESTR